MGYQLIISFLHFPFPTAPDFLFRIQVFPEADAYQEKEGCWSILLARMTGSGWLYELSLSNHSESQDFLLRRKEYPLKARRLMFRYIWKPHA